MKDEVKLIIYIDIFMLFFHEIFFNRLADVMMGKRSQEKNEPIDRKIFARNLRNARKDARLKQEDLVKTTGLSQAFISGVETGEANVSLDNASRLARAVGLSLRDLLDPLKK